MNELFQGLLKLQALDADAKRDQDTEKQIARLRTGIPAPILGHYDRLRARGKTCVAPVRNQVCAGCHMQVPRATVLRLMHGEHLEICDNCGRYLYLPEAVAAPPTPPAPKKRSRKSSPKRQMVDAA